jgi:hypothetical protein
MPSDEAAPLAPEAEEATGKSTPADLQMLDEAIFELPAEFSADDAIRTADQFADTVPLAANHHDDSDTPWTDEMLAAWYEQQLSDMSACELAAQMPHEMMTAILVQPDEINITDRFYPADNTIRHDLDNTTFIDAPTDAHARNDHTETHEAPPSEEFGLNSFGLTNLTEAGSDPQWTNNVDDQIFNNFEYAHSGKMTSIEAAQAVNWLTDVVAADQGFAKMAEVLYPQLDAVKNGTIVGTTTEVLTAETLITEPAQTIPQLTDQNLDAAVTFLSNILAEQPLIPAHPANDDGYEPAAPTNQGLNTNSDAESYTSAAPTSTSVEPVFQLA